MDEVFDFEWENKNLFYGAYKRTGAISPTALASSGIPQRDELKLLEPYRKALPPALFTEPFKLPVTDARATTASKCAGAGAVEAGGLARSRTVSWSNQDGQPCRLHDPAGRPVPGTGRLALRQLWRNSVST